MTTIKTDQIKKILIVQQRPFGDVLLSTSYLEALQKKFPEATIDFFVSEPFNQVVEGHPYIHRIIISPAKKRLHTYLVGRFFAILNVTAKRYDLLIDQQGNTGSAIITLFSFARYRIGRASTRGGKYFCNLKVTMGPERYHGNSNFDMLAPLGIAEQPYRLYLTIKPDSKEYITSWLAENGIAVGKYLCLCTQSPIQINRWNDDCFLQLIERITAETGLAVMLTYSPSERTAVASIAERAAGKAIMGPVTTFNQVAALLTSATCMIGLDGGLNHLSVATQTPSIAIFGKAATASWSPQGIFPHHYHMYKPHDRSDTTLGVAPDEVFALLQKLLDETGYTSGDRSSVS